MKLIGKLGAKCFYMTMNLDFIFWISILSLPINYPLLSHVLYWKNTGRNDSNIGCCKSFRWFLMVIYYEYIARDVVKYRNRYIDHFTTSLVYVGTKHTRSFQAHCPSIARNSQKLIEKTLKLPNIIN